MKDLFDISGFWLAGAPRRTAGSGEIGPPPPPPPPPLPPNQPPVAVADSVTVFAATPTVVDVLSNDSDPEGGALALVAAGALTGTVQILPANTLRYTSAPGFTGSDTVSYVVADAQGAQNTGTLAVTVAGPLLSVSPNSDGTLTVQAASGDIALTVSTPPEFAGTFVTNTALLGSGAINLVPPSVTGLPAPGAALVAQSGLWIHEGEVIAESWTWQRNGIAIAGADTLGYTVAPSDVGRVLRAVQTLATAAGSRSAASAPLAIPSVFRPSDDSSLIAWYDAADTATISATQGVVSTWASKAGTGSLVATSGPTTGSRTIAGRNVIDFSGTARMVGAVTVPASGNVAIHAVIAIDAVNSAFAAPLSMDATNDFQLDADNATAFAGRLNVTGIGTPFQLQGGPWSGALILSIVFDRTGTGLSRVLVNGVSVGSGAYVTRLDSGQSLAVMTNRSRNAFIDGAAGEVIVTGSVSNTSDYVGYLLQKWGII